MVATYTIPRTHLIIIFIVAFMLRACTFAAFTSQEERYKQPDSNDYHVAALCLMYGIGMCRPDTGEPLFWRTPGYPAYLVPFYKLFAPQGHQLSDAATAQKASIWFQIFLSSFIPLILFYLALYLTHVLCIAYAIACIATLHIGLVLTSGYLLTEGIALIPFYLFLYFFYRSIKMNRLYSSMKMLTLAAGMLALYTWIRPMGNYIAIVTALIILICTQDNLRLKGKKIALFLSCFYLLLMPWYIRNYQHTGHIFFCPMFGAYMNSFCAPRVVSAVEHIELLDAWRLLSSAAYQHYLEQKQAYLQRGVHLPKEFICGQIAWPIVYAYPLLVLYDWMREVFKTAFDLYSSQLVAFVQGCFFYDPLIEYLSSKLADCLYATPMPLLMRTIVYLELLYAILLWIGLIVGSVQFMIIPCIKRFNINTVTLEIFKLWLCVTPMIAAALFMTGGFGYARLRLPVEPLMIILSLTWYYYVFAKHTKGKHEASVLPLAPKL